MIKGTVGLCSPWTNYYKEVKALFEKDPQVNVTFDDATYVMKFFVEDGEKAAAIEALLPSEKVFGNIVVEIEVVPANDEVEKVYDDFDTEELTRAELFGVAFKDNPILFDVVEAGPLSYDFVIFKKEVVQYYNDDLSDAYGYRSTLYQVLAEEVFGIADGVLFSTEVPATDTLAED